MVAVLMVLLAFSAIGIKTSAAIAPTQLVPPNSWTTTNAIYWDQNWYPDKMGEPIGPDFKWGNSGISTRDVYYSNIDGYPVRGTTEYVTVGGGYQVYLFTSTLGSSDMLCSKGDFSMSLVGGTETDSPISYSLSQSSITLEPDITDTCIHNNDPPVPTQMADLEITKAEAAYDSNENILWFTVETKVMMPQMGDPDYDDKMEWYDEDIYITITEKGVILDTLTGPSDNPLINIAGDGNIYSEIGAQVGQFSLISVYGTKEAGTFLGSVSIDDWNPTDSQIYYWTKVSGSWTATPTGYDATIIFGDGEAEGVFSGTIGDCGKRKTCWFGETLGTISGSAAWANHPEWGELSIGPGVGGGRGDPMPAYYWSMSPFTREDPPEPPEPPVTTVDFDIKPSSVKLKSKGVIPVHIFTTDDFDATTIEVTTVKFGPGEAEEAHGKLHIEDVDDDGDLDVVMHFRVQESGLVLGLNEVTITGTYGDGLAFEGTDTVVGK